MTNQLSKVFKASLEISVICRKTKKKTRFYKADFIKSDISIEKAVDEFCKFLLKEYFILIKKDDDKRFVYNIVCNKEIGRMIINNGWTDQLFHQHVGSRSKLNVNITEGKYERKRR